MPRERPNIAKNVRAISSNLELKKNTLVRNTTIGNCFSLISYPTIRNEPHQYYVVIPMRKGINLFESYTACKLLVLKPSHKYDIMYGLYKK